ncbi:MAG TPA: hypothetical protein VG934_01660 [Candidatus Paceibacterota bacterium]|nr:hypothetical protein [Candidatus Paceibacterota bacterium]
MFNNWKFLGILPVLLAGLVLAGCTTDDSGGLSAAIGSGAVPPTGVAQNPGTIATTITSQSGASVDVFAIDVNRKQKLLIPVVSKPGFFKPSIVAAGFAICNKDPNCPQISNVIGGVGEPTGNVLIGGVANVLGAYLGRSGGDNFNLSATGGTGYGGQATSYGSTVTNTNKNTNKSSSSSKSDSSSSSKSKSSSDSSSKSDSSSSGSGDNGSGGKPPKDGGDCGKPGKPKCGGSGGGGGSGW